MSRKNTVLVIGGAGYIGSEVCRALLGRGENVRVLDVLAFGPSSVQDLMDNPDFELVVDDCCDRQVVRNVLRGVDRVIHLAAVVGDGACAQYPAVTTTINCVSAVAIAELAKEQGVERFVFASTCSVYGASEDTVNETSPTNPLSLYAATKLTAEQGILAMRTDRFKPTILRLATVFGFSPRPRFDLVVNLLTARAYCEKKITVVNGHQWRPFIHVRDAARGFIAAIDADLSESGVVMNLGDDALNYTILQAGQIIRELLPDTEVSESASKDFRNYNVSFARISDVLGFRCTLDLEFGIREIIAAIEERRVGSYKDSIYGNEALIRKRGPAVLAKPGVQPREWVPTRPGRRVGGEIAMSARS
jgi:nucleoside-diphosphate-sugar epimerase